MTIIKHEPRLMSLDKARDLVDTLNAEEDEDWTYRVVASLVRPGLAYVAADDEDGEFIGYL